MNQTTKEFIKEYKVNFSHVGNNQIVFFPGHEFTSPFGLTQGYRIINGIPQINGKWDSMYIHVGVDRSARGKNLIYAPFDSTKTDFIDFGGKDYGTLVRLINENYGFEVRLAHMSPSDIPLNLLKALENNKPLPRGTIIGKAGNYGTGTAAHLHTEIVSLDSSCVVLDDIIEGYYEEEGQLNYSDDYVINFAKSTTHLGKWSNEMILAYWRAELKRRHVIEGKINDYRYHYFDVLTQRNATRYSSQKLFGM